MEKRAQRVHVHVGYQVINPSQRTARLCVGAEDPDMFCGVLDFRSWKVNFARVVLHSNTDRTLGGLLKKKTRYGVRQEGRKSWNYLEKNGKKGNQKKSSRLFVLPRRIKRQILLSNSQKLKLRFLLEPARAACEKSSQNHIRRVILLVLLLCAKDF